MNTSQLSIKYTIDAQGLRCPAPLLKARLGLKQLSAGESLEILLSDVDSVKDIKTMVELTNNTIELYEEQQNIYRYVLKKGQ
jgi:tRNA 2-thiouridine synthesizing protein A